MKAGISPTDRPSLALVTELDANRQPLGPEIGVPKREGRPSSAAQAVAQGRLGGVDGEIDLVARSCHVGPVKKRVADREPEPIGRLIAQRQAYFGNDGEFRGTVSADVGRQSEETARFRRQTIHTRGAVDDGGAAIAAQRQLAREAQEGPAAGVLGNDADLAAMEAVPRAKSFVDEDGDAEQRIVGVAANLSFGNVQILVEPHETITAQQIDAAAAAAADILPQVGVRSPKLAGLSSREV